VSSRTAADGLHLLGVGELLLEPFPFRDVRGEVEDGGSPFPFDGNAHRLHPDGNPVLAHVAIEDLGKQAAQGARSVTLHRLFHVILVDELRNLPPDHFLAGEPEHVEEARIAERHPPLFHDADRLGGGLDKLSVLHLGMVKEIP
jgi:hypothetical protein